MSKRGFSNVFSEKKFVQNQEFVDACKHLKITLDVQMVYSSLHWLSIPKGYAWPSQKFLANEIGRSLRTAKTHTAKLKDLGLITVKQRCAGQTALYYPLPKDQLADHIIALAQGGSEPPSEVQKNSPNNGCNCTDPRVHISPHLYKEIITSNNSPNTPKGDEEAEASFEKLWEAWPIKQARKFAYRTFMRLCRKGIVPNIETLLKAIECLRENDTAWLRGKVSLLHRWLRGERWEDVSYVEEVAPTTVHTSTTTFPITPELVFSEREEEIQEQYLELLVTVSNRKPLSDINRITAKVIASLGGIKELYAKGMDCLSLDKFSSQYQSLSQCQGVCYEK